ncbi:unnamed protein product, partial [Amoebophrya sp. A25]
GKKTTPTDSAILAVPDEHNPRHTDRAVHPHDLHHSQHPGDHQPSHQHSSKPSPDSKSSVQVDGSADNTFDVYTSEEALLREQKQAAVQALNSIRALLHAASKQPNTTNNSVQVGSGTAATTPNPSARADLGTDLDDG